MFSKRVQRISMVRFIIVLNVLIFCAWKFGAEYLPAYFMEEHFLVSWSAITEGRYWVALTSVFSHNMLLHLLVNMFVLNSFGGFLETFFGAKRILLFFVVAGIIGSLVHAFTSAFYVGNPNLLALGASGGVAGVILLFSLMFPKEKILLMGIIPIPAIFGAFAFMGLDMWGLYTQAQGGGLPIGHGAHLGGAFTGVIYFIWLKFSNKRKLLVRKRDSFNIEA